MAIDLTQIPQLARNLHRLTEIAAVLIKYGLAEWFSRLDYRFINGIVRRTPLATIAGVSFEARVRLALTELGTTYIKFGQVLSTRRDLIGQTLADELSQLQTNVQPDPFPVSKATLEKELQKTLEQVFVCFDEKPIASASIGQVYKATLFDGRVVAVKIQHPDISRKIENDLSILSTLAELAEANLSDVRLYRPVKIVEEFQRVIRRELDFRRESRNLELFTRNFKKDPSVKIPQPILEFSTERVLVMEFLDGIPLADFEGVKATGRDLDEIAMRGARLYLDMVFKHGFFHADPHPGNVLIMPDGTIGLIDAGMVGRVDDTLKHLIEGSIRAIVSEDVVTLTDLILQVGDVPSGIEPSELQAEVADQLGYYWGMPLEQFHIGPALNELTEAIRRFHIGLPPTLSLLLKVLIVLEGTGHRLSPKFNLAILLSGYQKSAMKSRLSPRTMARRMWEAARDWDDLVRGLPKQIKTIFRQAQKQDITVRLRHEHLEPSVNRLVFGLLTSALFVGSSFMWSYQAPPLFHGVSIFGVVGCSIACVLGFRLFRAIQHSGKLEERKD